ncbi:MAG: hypothetical protein IJK17_02840 [Lachnospiraceae bacterium]|nr:hypothetical protein [Lachnospiraceae bacterium]
MKDFFRVLAIYIIGSIIILILGFGFFDILILGFPFLTFIVFFFLIIRGYTKKKKAQNYKSYYLWAFVLLTVMILELAFFACSFLFGAPVTS